MKHDSPSAVSLSGALAPHEGQVWTLHALSKIIEAPIEAGYELVTVSELLDN